jgi:hypothetical protein
MLVNEVIKAFSVVEFVLSCDVVRYLELLFTRLRRVRRWVLGTSPIYRRSFVFVYDYLVNLHKFSMKQEGGVCQPMGSKHPIELHAISPSPVSDTQPHLLKAELSPIATKISNNSSHSPCISL